LSDRDEKEEEFDEREVKSAPYTNDEWSTDWQSNAIQLIGNRLTAKTIHFAAFQATSGS
jgi:hypothetical protein